VLIPAFRHAAFIEAALESVKALTHRRLELIVVDDCSPDETAVLAEAWVARNLVRFERAEVLRNPVNLGITKNLNRLVSMAQGDFIVLLASDDELLPDGVTCRLEALSARPDCLAVIGDSETMDEEGRTTQASTFVETYHACKAALLRPDLIVEELVLRWSIPGPVILLRREAFDSEKGVGPYDESLYFEDRDFYLRLLGRQALVFVDHPVARYRVMAQSACRADEVQATMSRHMIRAQSKNLACLPLYCRTFLRLDNARLWFQAREQEGARWVRRLPGRRSVYRIWKWMKRHHDRRLAKALSNRSGQVLST
jgi:glycosyltransferase involved in cell wall biosynthesis